MLYDPHTQGVQHCNYTLLLYYRGEKTEALQPCRSANLTIFGSSDKQNTTYECRQSLKVTYIYRITVFTLHATDVCLYPSCLCTYGCHMSICPYLDHAASSSRPFFLALASSFLLKPERHLNMKTMLFFNYHHQTKNTESKENTKSEIMNHNPFTHYLALVFGCVPDVKLMSDVWILFPHHLPHGW